MKGTLDYLHNVCCNNGQDDEDEDDEVFDKDAANGTLSHVGTAAYEALRTQHGRHHHKLWNVTSGKVIGKLHQTPLQAFTSMDPVQEEGHSDWFPAKLKEITCRTEVWCDVMSLGPPDGLFMECMNEALLILAAKAKADQKIITVRIMFGNIIGMPVNCTAVLKRLTQGIFVDPKCGSNSSTTKNMTNNRNSNDNMGTATGGDASASGGTGNTGHLQVWVGSWRRGVSWNHAKMIAVDGRFIHTGGHNLWHYHYLTKHPVHDLSLELEGRVAHDGHLYANEQWAFVERIQNTAFGQLVNALPDYLPVLVSKSRVTVTEFPAGVASTFPPQYSKKLVPKQLYNNRSTVPIISVGRYGSISWAGQRPSDDAFCAMLSSARTVIRLALQDLGPVCIPGTKIPLPGCVWPERYLSILGRVIWERGVDVEIVLSNPGSVPGGLKPTEGCYGNGWTCVDVAAEIIKTIRVQFGETAIKDAQIRQKVDENLRVCFLRQMQGQTYDDDTGMTVAMHAKHFIIDDCCCYIGSQNLYICDLAEWGVVIDNAKQTEKFMEEYWKPMWTASYNPADCDVQEVMDGLKINRNATVDRIDQLPAEEREKLQQQFGGAASQDPAALAAAAGGGAGGGAVNPTAKEYYNTEEENDGAGAAPL